jgi:photosystem II stability/assembly factor-like uncharacterized protein
MSDRLLVATRKGLFTVARSGGSWRVVDTAFFGDTLTLAMADPRSGVHYAALHHGHFGAKLQRSSDGGRTWEECGVPAYPPMPEGHVEIDPIRQTPLQWKLDRIWALETGHADEPGVLWCGTIPGGLFRSEDGGTSWRMIRSLWDHPSRRRWTGGGADLPGIHSICVDPRDRRRVAVGVSCGGVWLTEDGGETWENRARGMRAAYMPPDLQFEPNAQDPHRVVQCRSRPDCLWAQHHNGVFRSTDDCRSWQEVESVQPSVFGFAAAVHPDDPDTVWLVPGVSDQRRVPVEGKVVVSRTRDGGKSWDVLRQGLPQEHAYDITYRHGLDIDGAGRRLAFGSTTGSLWVSEDQGDSWRTVAQHLPPIYSVRFIAER